MLKTCEHCLFEASQHGELIRIKFFIVALKTLLITSIKLVRGTKTAKVILQLQNNQW